MLGTNHTSLETVKPLFHFPSISLYFPEFGFILTFIPRFPTPPFLALHPYFAN